jgi:uncharacterized phage protein (TIGR01671 family)
MNREIKFRAWNNIEMKNVDQITFTKKTWLCEDGYGVSMPYQPSVTLMQYTGLKDKKRTEQFPEGQEIYEGDILADKNNLDVSMTIVEYDEFLGSYIFKHLAEESLYFRNETYSIYITEVEVIGNVYQNPELLGV